MNKEQILEHLKNIPEPDDYVKEFIRQIEGNKNAQNGLVD